MIWSYRSKCMSLSLASPNHSFCFTKKLGDRATSKSTTRFTPGYGGSRWVGGERWTLDSRKAGWVTRRSRRLWVMRSDRGWNRWRNSRYVLLLNKLMCPKLSNIWVLTIDKSDNFFFFIWSRRFGNRSWTLPWDWSRWIRFWPTLILRRQLSSHVSMHTNKYKSLPN